MVWGLAPRFWGEWSISIKRDYLWPDYILIQCTICSVFFVFVAFLGSSLALLII